MMISGLTEGVYRCGSDRANWYPLEDDNALTVIDTGFPTHRQEFLHRLDEPGYDRTDIEACPLTVRIPISSAMQSDSGRRVTSQCGCTRQMSTRPSRR